MAYGSIASLAVDISADIGRLRSDFQQANREASTQMAGLRRNVEREFAGIEARAKSAGQAVLASLGAIGTIEITKRLTEVADSYSNIQSKLKLVTRDQQELVKTSNDVFNAAQKTYTSYDAMATIVGRTTRSLEALGATNEKALADAKALSVVVSEGLMISGASASEAASSVQQLTQALASNKLAGDEFRAFMENSPRLSIAVSKALGITIGDLRKLSAEGKINTEILTKALMSQAQVIEQEFASVPLTVGRAWQMLSNDFTVYIGQSGQASGVTMGLANAIIFLGDHLDDVGRIVAAGAVVAFGRQVSSVTTAVAAWVEQQKMTAAYAQATAMNAARDAAAQAGVATATAAAAEAKLAATRATAAQVDATAAVIAVAREEQIIKLRSLEVEAAMASATLAAAQARGAQSAAIAVAVDAEAALMRIQAARMAVVNELAALGANNARSMAAQTVAAEALAVAEAQVAAAQEAAAVAATQAGAAQTAAAGATGAAAVGIRGLGAGLLAFVGGPVGLTIAGVAALAYGLYALSESADSAEKKADELIAQFNKAAAAARNFSTNPIEMINSSSMQVDVELMKQYTAEVDKLKQMQSKTSVGFGEVMRATEIDAQKERVSQLKGKIDELRVSTAMAAEAERERANAMKASNPLADEAKKLLADMAGNSKADAKAHKESVKAWEADQKALEGYAEKYAKWVEQTTKGFDAVRDSVDPMAELNSKFEEQKSQLEEATMLWAGQPAKIAEVQRVMELLSKQYRKNKAAAEDLFNPHKKMVKDVTDKIAEQWNKVRGLTDAEVAYNVAVREANQLAQEDIADGRNQVKVAEQLAEHIGKLAELRDATDVANILGEFTDTNGFDDLIKKINKVEEALRSATDPEIIAQMREALANMKDELGTRLVGSAKEGLQSLQSMTKEGSKGFRILQVAIDATTLAEAVLAVIHQASSGDVYTAIPRMAAMVAAIAALGVSIGNVSGGGGPSAQSAEYRQEHQGTGTVLGDATAQSESIAHAVEITASATTELVGLNRGMLNALHALQSALGAAGNLLARGAGDVAFPGLSDGPGYGLMGPYGQYDPMMNAMTGGYDPLGQAIGGFLWGGDQSVIDQGIVIAGGTLQDMLDGIVVGAYQTIETDGGLFGDDEISDNVVGVSEEFTTQFQLVIGSIVDTVRAGAEALGLLPADIQAAIDEFQIAETHISLQGLSAEDQQKAIEAVFSQIFDNLAGAVVPFIDQFQQVGEGLGETLVRVATEVQVTQEAFRQLGISVSETDPERFAQIADGLVQATGGLDAFMSSLQTFTNAFASDDQQLTTMFDSLTSAFEQAGLVLPNTRDGMWDLLQTLDATTAEGREQIATILRLAAASDKYYDALDKQAEKIADAKELLGDMGFSVGTSDFERQIHKIKEQADKAAEALDLLAHAEGRSGASAQDLARVQRWAADQARRAIAALRNSTADLISQLYGGNAGTLDEINRRIAEAESSQTDSIGAVGDAADDMYQRQLDAIKQISDFLDSLLLGDLTTLTPEQQLMEAQRQYNELLAAAQAGDPDALAALPAAAQQYLALARSFYSATDGYTQIFDDVTAALAEIVDTGPTANPGSTGGNGSNGGVSSDLQALYEQRDAMLAQQDAQNRMLLAQQLAGQLNDLAHALGIPVFQLADQMGVSIDQLVADLGINLDNFSETTGSQLAAVADMLGVTVPELADQLGISMEDLVTSMGLNLTDLSQNTAASIGEVAATLGLTVPELASTLGISMTDLVSALGVNLDDLTVSTVQSMAQVAQDMGISLVDLAESVGVDLGDLADSQSLLNQSLSATIDTLPVGTRDMLRPLLDAIANATTEADANAAIQALKDATQDLPEDQRALLAPYFDEIDPTEQLDDLDWLQDISTAADNQLLVLGDISGYLNQIDRNTRHTGGGGSGNQAAGAASNAMYNQMFDASSGLAGTTAAMGAAYAAYGDDAAAQNGALVSAIDRLRECVEESDEETRMVLEERLRAIEEAVYGSSDQTGVQIGKAMGRNRGNWSK